MKKLLWTPSAEQKEASVVNGFMKFVNERNGSDMNTYEELYDWSVTVPVKFWEAIWDYFDVIGDKAGGFDTEETPEFIKMNWFPGTKMNYTENMLRYMEGSEDGIVFYGEDQVVRRMSRDEVKTQVLSFANALKKAGIRSGDIVAAYMPNLPETVIAMLGTSAIGAVWCSCATDVGARVAIDRIGQTKPRLLVTADGYYYKGKVFSTEDNVKEITDAVDSIEKVVVTHFAGSGTLDSVRDTISWEDFLASSGGTDFVYERFGFDHPQVIMFSSGTTGKPKCMVQSAIGLLLNQIKELAVMTDLGAKDRLLYITTCSWMMWNWQAAALVTGATLILYDGNPSYPDNGAIWRILEKEKVTVFGLSASYIHMLLNQGFSPKSEVDLSALREISQTGSALSDDGFDYVYREIKEDLFFNSIAGGTDINGCFAIGSPLRPVWSSELQGPGLGMKINCYDDNGKPIRDTEGELVCEFPAPCMPIYFWNDPDGTKYHNAYFDVFPGIWRHGDFVIFDSKTGGISFRGRSDSVLKPSGVRIGTAEIYNQVEKLPEIEDSLAIGQDHGGDQRVLLFVKLNEGYEYSEELGKKIKKTLREGASPRHVPAMIFPVDDIPFTMNGKKVESAVTNIMNGRDVTNRSALSNPDALDIYIGIRDDLLEKGI